MIKKLRIPNTDKVYNVNTRLVLIFSLVSLVIVSFMVGSYIQMPYKYYMECKDRICFNEYYQSDSCGKLFPADRPICTQEYFYEGQTDGTKEPPIQQYGGLIILGLLVIFGTINHGVHNERKNI